MRGPADAPPGNVCAACGARITAGRNGCQRLFEHFNGLAAEDARFAGVHRLFVDAYCMQHLEPYAHSPKSYAAHLMGLCCGVERNGELTGYTSIHRWLNGAPVLERPNPPMALGDRTIVDVMASDAVAHRESVTAWARAVWTAYASQHALARHWLDTAEAACRTFRRK